MLLEADDMNEQGAIVSGGGLAALPLGVVCFFPFHIKRPGLGPCKKCSGLLANQRCDPTCGERGCGGYIYNPTANVGEQWETWNGEGPLVAIEADGSHAGGTSAPPMPPMVAAAVQQYHLVMSWRDALREEERKLSHMVTALDPKDVAAFVPEGFPGVAPGPTTPLGGPHTPPTRVAPRSSGIPPPP